MPVEPNMRHSREIPVFVLSENSESVMVSSSHVSPTGVSFRLPKRKDKMGIFVVFKHRKIYETNWIRKEVVS